MAREVEAERKLEQNLNDESSSASASGTCPICLSPVLQESYLDHCFHKFCYCCILQWTEVVTSKHSPRQSFVKCPLCKTKSDSIIYGYDGTSFQQHLIYQNSEKEKGFFTKAHKYRLQCYYIHPMENIVNISLYWKTYKYRQPNQWLYNWLTREIQALIQEEDVDIIVYHIIGVIDSWRKNEEKWCKVCPEEEFKRVVAEAAKPFLRGRSDGFVDELVMFLASGWNIKAYDKVYRTHLGSKSMDEQTPIIPYLYFSDDADTT